MLGRRVGSWIAAAAAVAVLVPAAAAARVHRAEDILPPGQSGYVSTSGVASGTGSPHLKDQLPLFYKHRFKPDMFNLPAADNPVPNPPVTGTMVFLANMERLKLEPEKLLSVHALNPDRLATVADIKKSLGQ